jgi:hypothetical protein
MYKKSAPFIFILILAITAFACGLPGNLIPAGLGSGSSKTTVSGTNGLKAIISSPVTVELNWSAVAGAKSYRVELQVGKSDFLQLVELAGDQTSFLNFPAPENSPLTYRVTAVMDAGDGEGRTVSLTTSALKPNPFTVQTQEYPNQPWTPPTAAPNATLDPSQLYPPGYDPNNPGSFDPSLLMGTPPSISQLIGPQGGSLTVTSRDNVTYKLDVPAGAVEDSIVLTLTPIQGVDKLPLSGGLLGAVRIEPQGFLLSAPATLTISLPKASPAPSGMAAVAFAFNNDGSEFHLVPIASPSPTSANPSGTPYLVGSLLPAQTGIPAPVVFKLGGSSATSGQESATIKVINNILDLSTQGVGMGTGPDIHNLVENHPPSDAGAQTDQAIAAGQAEDELAPLVKVPSQASSTSPDPQLVSAAQGLLNEASAATSWNSFESVANSFEKYFLDGGKTHGPESINNQIWDQLVAKAKALLDANKRQCISKDDFNAQELADQLITAKDDFSTIFTQKFTQKYGAQYLQDVADMTKKCKLTLQITSTISYQMGDITVSAAIKASIPLKWKYDSKSGNSFLYGSGKIVYTLFDVNSPDCKNIKLNQLSGSTFTVQKLEPVFNSKGSVTDFRMAEGDYVIAGLQKQVSGQCRGGGGTGAGKNSGDIWGGLYTLAHMSSMLIKDWQLSTPQPPGSGKIADNTYTAQNRPVAGGAGNIVENTTFTLIKGTP